MKFSLPSAAIAWSALLLSNLSLATPVSINSDYQLEKLGSFSGSLDYSATSTSGTLTLILNNLPATAAGGSITGVALNLPTISGISFTSLSLNAPADFTQLGSYTNSNAINSSPLGDFDFGSASVNANGMGTPSWQGSGNPKVGIAIGSSGTFVFNFTGSNLNSLSAISFVNAVASGNTSGPSEFIAVRFRGFTGTNNGKSDKVGGMLTPEPYAPPVPVPASVWLMLSGLGGLGFISRKRKSAM